MFVYLLLLFVVLDNNSLSYMPGTVFGGIFLGFRFRLPEGCGPSGQAWQACARYCQDLLLSGKRRVFRSQDY